MTSAASLAKAVSIHQPAPRYSGSIIDVVKENHVLADQNHALAIVVGQMKSREIEAAHTCRALEESRHQLSLDYDRLYSDYWIQCYVIDDRQARLANNNADLISELQENITSLEEAAEEVSWTDWRQSGRDPPARRYSR